MASILTLAANVLLAVYGLISLKGWHRWVVCVLAVIAFLAGVRSQRDAQEQTDRIESGVSKVEWQSKPRHISTEQESCLMTRLTGVIGVKGQTLAASNDQEALDYALELYPIVKKAGFALDGVQQSPADNPRMYGLTVYVNYRRDNEAPAGADGLAQALHDCNLQPEPPPPDAQFKTAFHLFDIPDGEFVLFVGHKPPAR